MAQEIKNTFLKSKMNKDLDDRILPNGEYRDARNISVGRSEDNDVGALENIIGNNLMASTDLQDINLEIIGLKESAVDNTFYIFLTDFTDPNPSTPTTAPEGSKHYIYAFNTITQAYIKLVEGEFLNFSKTNRIIGINLVESLLFWTDNRNQPRKINTAVFNNVSQGGRSTNQQYYTQEHQISVAKYSPFEAIRLYIRTQITVKSADPSRNWVTVNGDQVTELTPYIGAAVVSLDVSSLTGSDYIFITSVVLDGTDTKITFNIPLDLAPSIGDILIFIKSTMSNEDSNQAWAGDPNYLEDIFVRFSYRFKYDDNEYSLMAPFTQIAYIPKQKGYFISGDEDAAYRSTILDFMENNVQNIGLIIPLPDLAVRVPSTYKISELEILFRKSGEVAVRVLESVPITEVILNSEAGTNLYTYDYQSRKPYRTLPEAQTVRVYDKVPVTAFAQEVAGNRVIYGNYKDKHTPPPTIDYNCRVSHKNTSGFYNNFIEYPNHSLKRNRNYQVGFVLADKFGRQSPVILSRVDTGSSVGGAFFSGSTLYSPYDSEEIATSPQGWFGDAIVLALNSPIQSLRSEATGTPGLYAVPQRNESPGDGFAIGTGGSTGINGNVWNFRYTGGTYPLNQNIPEPGQYLRGEYTDFVKVLTITGPLANLYTVTTTGQVNSSYLPSDNQPVGYPDIRFAYAINDLGWYSYKIVVKQTEQDYYNVYLPGILNGYPGQSLLPNSTIIGDGSIEGAFPSDEMNLTAHTVLLNDNINKIPRDLTEVGPDQRQFRSSVKLYGRVQNTMNLTPNVNDDPDPSNLQYYTTVAGSKNAISHTAIAIATARDLEMSFNQLSNSNSNITTEEWVADANQVNFGITKFTASQLQNNLIALNNTSIPEPNKIEDFDITGTTLTLDSILGAGINIKLTVTGPSIAAGGTDGDKTFYQIDSNPLIARISTKSKGIGWGAIQTANPESVSGGYNWNMQPYLAVYETEPTISLLDIYWETTSEGYIADLNSEVISGYDGITSLQGIEFDFPESKEPGEAITGLFAPYNAQGVFINNTTAILTSVIDNSSPPQNMTDRFELVVLDAAPNVGKYQLRLASGIDGFVFTEGSNLTDVFTFEIQSTTGAEVTTNTIQGIIGGDGALKNVAPDVVGIALPPQNWEVTTAMILPANVWTSSKITNGSSVLELPLPAGGYNTLGLVFSMTDIDPYNAIADWGWEMDESNGQITQVAGATPAGTYKINIIATDANNIANGGIDPYSPLSYEQEITIIIGDDGLNDELTGAACIVEAPDATASVPADGPILIQSQEIAFNRGATPGISSGIWYITAEDPNEGLDAAEGDVSPIFDWSTGPGGRRLVNKAINNTGGGADFYPSGGWEYIPDFSEDQGAAQSIDKWMFRMGTGAHTSGSLVFNMTIAGRGSLFGLGINAPTQWDAPSAPTHLWFDGELKIYVRRVGENGQQWKELIDSDISEINNATNAHVSWVNPLVSTDPVPNTDWPRARTGGKASENDDPGEFYVSWKKPTNEAISYNHFIKAFAFNEIALNTDDSTGIEYAIVINALTGISTDINRAVAWLTIDDLNDAFCTPWQGLNPAAITEYTNTGSPNAFLYNKSSWGDGRVYQSVNGGGAVYFAKTPYIDYVTSFFDNSVLTTPIVPADNTNKFLNYYLSLSDTGTNPGFTTALPYFKYGGSTNNPDFNAQMVSSFSGSGSREVNSNPAFTNASLIGNAAPGGGNDTFDYRIPTGTDGQSGSLNTGMSRLRIKK